MASCSTPCAKPNPDRTTAHPLQYRQAAQRIGVSSACSRKHRSDGPEAHDALTIKPDHPMGACHLTVPSNADRSWQIPFSRRDNLEIRLGAVNSVGGQKVGDLHTQWQKVTSNGPNNSVSHAFHPWLGAQSSHRRQNE